MNMLFSSSSLIRQKWLVAIGSVVKGRPSFLFSSLRYGYQLSLGSGGHSTKIGIHVSRKIYHFIFLKTHIMLFISNLNFGSISCLLLEMQNEICEMAKCDMRITFHVTQMPNVNCEKTWNIWIQFFKKCAPDVKVRSEPVPGMKTAFENHSSGPWLPSLSKFLKCGSHKW